MRPIYISALSLVFAGSAFAQNPGVESRGHLIAAAVRSVAVHLPDGPARIVFSVELSDSDAESVSRSSGLPHGKLKNVVDCSKRDNCKLVGVKGLLNIVGYDENQDVVVVKIALGKESLEHPGRLDQTWYAVRMAREGGVWRVASVTPFMIS